MQTLKHRLILLLLVVLVLVLSGCDEQLNPLLKNEATEAPGLETELFSATADEENTEQIKATLYFRYMDEPMLAAESRVITVRSDQRPEQAILEALLAGPSAGNADLQQIIPADVELVGISDREQVLYVTFSEAFLEDDVPDDWETDEAWVDEAPLLRELITQSIVASITESCVYTGVQIMVYQEDVVQTSLRLDNEYFLDGSVGLSEPVIRDESLLLTPQTTAKTILDAWQQQDYERIYKYLADQPIYTTFVEALDPAPTLDTYTVSGGSVYSDGQTAVVTVYLRLIYEDKDDELLSYPLQLIRDNDVWKIEYETLTALMLGT